MAAVPAPSHGASPAPAAPPPVPAPGAAPALAPAGAPAPSGAAEAIVLLEAGPELDGALGGALATGAASLLGAAGYGAAVVRSPEADAGAAAGARKSLSAGLAAYDALRFEEAVRYLEAAEAAAVASGAAGLTAGELADVFLFRGMALHQLKDPRAWDDFVLSALYAPGRTLDPTRFPPAARERYGRAAAEVAAKPRGAVAVAGPAGARVWIDGAEAGPVPARVEGLPAGSHLVRVELGGHRPWITRVAVAGPEVTVTARPEPAPPALGGADAAALAAYGAARGASLVVAIRAPLPDGAAGETAPTSSSSSPSSVPLARVTAVRVSDRAEIVSATLRGTPDKPDDAGAAIGLLLRPLLPEAAGGGPAVPPVVRRSPFVRWLPAIVAAGVVLVAGGVAAAIFAARDPGMPGFGAFFRPPGE